MTTIRRAIFDDALALALALAIEGPQAHTDHLKIRSAVSNATVNSLLDFYEVDDRPATSDEEALLEWMQRTSQLFEVWDGKDLMPLVRSAGHVLVLLVKRGLVRVSSLYPDDHA